MASGCPDNGLKAPDPITECDDSHFGLSSGKNCDRGYHKECDRVQCTTKSEIRMLTDKNRENPELLPMEIVRLVTMRLLADEKQRQSLVLRIRLLKGEKEQMDNGRANELMGGLMHHYQRLVVKIELGEELLHSREVNLEGLREIVNRKHGTEIERRFFEQVCEEFRRELMERPAT